MKRIPTAVAASFLSLAVFAEPANPTFPPEKFRAHVTFLADELLEGRETGTRGYDIAARYVASQFESFGLEPGGVDGSYFQPVTFQRTVRGEGAALTLIGAGGERRFAHADHVLIGISPRERTQDVTARLVFVGYGLEDKRLGLDDYRGLDVRGAIVVTLRGFPKSLPSEEGAHVSAQKAKVAQKHGAIGLFSVSTPQFDKVFPWEQMLHYANDPDVSWVKSDGEVFEEAPAIRARAALNGPAAEMVFAGARRSFADVRAETERDKGMPRGFPLETRVRLQSSSDWTRITSANVIAIQRGEGPAADEYVTLLAHLDHLGVKDGKVHSGALDNAAGVATLLEVARAAAADGESKRSMMFLAVTGEEYGLLGAEYFARHPTVPIDRIVGNVGLDMPLLLYPFSDVIAFGANHSTLGRIVEQAVAPMNIRLAADPMPEQGVFTRSDHYALVKQGVPAVFLMTGMASGGEKVWGEFLGGGVYHSPGDNLSQPFDWNAAARFAEANYRITRLMADAQTPPLWFKGDYFGDEFAPKAKRAAR